MYPKCITSKAALCGRLRYIHFRKGIFAVYKLCVALLVLSFSAACTVRCAADDECFIGTTSPLVKEPGSAMAAIPENQPILDEANAIKTAFDVQSPLFESDVLWDFSTKSGNVYVGKPLIDYLTAQNGTDPTSNGVGFMIAHEYAHQFQFKIWESGHDAQQESVIQNELQADFIAASWYGMHDRHALALLRRQIGPSFDREIGVQYEVAKIQQIADQSGAYLGWTPHFHGTQQQRDAAVKAGVQYGEDFYKATPDDAYKSYANEIYDASKQSAELILAQ